MISQLEKLQTELDTLRDELQDKLDNMYESIEDSDYEDGLQDAIDSLETASFDGLGTALDELRNAELSLETLPEAPRNEEDIDIDISVPLAAGLIYFDRKRSEEKRQNQQKQESTYDPYDTHWGSSFDWVDEDNDGYDDRDDGFWIEREF